ncbi:MAG: methylated-DNA--[protein]-cysteine S-methyltransferase [Zoogloeaceae bacterium]|jgi:methylated-DNA-[protein]-cysteine S-methyltransferase|nr:methylated-DNA--[protein]-cysteine S-methyltransferase [Zoogloeaceae bacterium]
MQAKRKNDSCGGADFQAVLAAPFFALGLCCDDAFVRGLTFLPPRAELLPQTPLARTVAEVLSAWLKNPATCLDLPFAAKGTEHQRAVWAVIAGIPCGKTRSYGEIAQMLNTSARAVGNACAANPLPIVVPCHRVLTSKGALGGFSGARSGWLLEIKRWLLARENISGTGK